MAHTNSQLWPSRAPQAPPQQSQTQLNLQQMSQRPSIAPTMVTTYQPVPLAQTQPLTRIITIMDPAITILTITTTPTTIIHTTTTVTTRHLTIIIPARITTATITIIVTIHLS